MGAVRGIVITALWTLALLDTDALLFLLAVVSKGEGGCGRGVGLFLPAAAPLVTVGWEWEWAGVVTGWMDWWVGESLTAPVVNEGAMSFC